MMALHLSAEQLDAYLDNELAEADRHAAEAHLASCSDCRSSIANRRRLLTLIQSGKPTEAASAALRQRIEGILRQTPEIERRSWRDRWRNRIALNWHTWAIGTMAAFGLIAAFTWVTVMHKQAARADAFVQAAVGAHTRRLRGDLPLQVQTESDRQLTQWFAPKLQFPFRLPQYEKNGQVPTAYQTLGGSLVSFGGHHAAFVAYRMQNGQPVSLLVTSAQQAVAEGGSVVVDQRLAFHSVNHENLQIVTWTVHGVTYALVSGLDLPPKQSCLVCHSPTASKKQKQIVAVHGGTLIQRSANCETVMQSTFMPGLLAYR